jgi:hypothetical protein
MMLAPEAKRGGIYKRMETDAEYQARLRAAGHHRGGNYGHPVDDFHGSALDAFGDSHEMQRRIVESSAD